MRVTKDYVFFFTDKDVFSNWYPCSFMVGSNSFNSVEKYMMYKKALLFKDNKTAWDILELRGIGSNEKLGAFYKRMGRKVSGFDPNVWEENKEQIVKDGLWLKFNSNPNLKQELLSYPGKTFVEASPYDAVYGIKMGMHEKGVEDPANWKGENLLGKWLTELRDHWE